MILHKPEIAITNYARRRVKGTSSIPSTLLTKLY